MSLAASCRPASARSRNCAAMVFPPNIQNKSLSDLLKVVPPFDPFGVVGPCLMLLHDPLGHQRTGRVRVPCECTVPEHSCLSFGSSDAVHIITIPAEHVPQVVDLAIKNV